MHSCAYAAFWVSSFSPTGIKNQKPLNLFFYKNHKAQRSGHEKCTSDLMLLKCIRYNKYSNF